MATHTEALSNFDAAIATARTADAAFKALQDLAQATVGSKLFTVMTVDMEAGLARRAYTNNAAAYPTSGTKPIQPNGWFDIVHGQKRSFIANTLADIANVFPDHELIGSLGLGSVVNLPIVLNGELAATINMLDVPGHYTPGRVCAIETQLGLPSRLAYLAARQFDSSGKSGN